MLILLLNVVLKLLVSRTNFHHQRVITLILFDVQSICSHQVQVLFDVLDWEFYVKLLDIELDLIVDLVTFSGLEFNGSVVEKFITLFIDISLRYPKLTNIILGVS